MTRKKFISFFLKKQSISFNVYHNGNKIKEVVDLKDIKLANDIYINYKLSGYQIKIIDR